VGAAYRERVLQTALWTLRQRRYAAMAVLMAVVAVICGIAGTWQIERFNQSVRDNNALTANAHAAPVPLTTALVPLVGPSPDPSRDAIRYRAVTVTGTYEADAQLLVNQSVSGNDGFYVVNPLRTSDGVVLVVRGFVPEKSDGSPPATIAAPPTGAVTVTGQLQTPDTANDGASELGHSQIETVNPREQATRFARPTFNAYLTLAAGQPGTAALTPLPAPDLSNPAGGAYEWQHFSYIVQWYLFALLALAAPFVIGRHEVREAQRQFLGIDPGRLELEDDRVGPELTTGSGAGREIAVRADGTLARSGEASTEQWERAARLADRYGRSLGRGHEAPKTAPGVRAARIGPRPAAEASDLVTNSAAGVHRPDDSYQGSYNDYLWELALADGSTPGVSLRPPLNSVEDGGETPTPARIIESTAPERDESAD
jgi:cytochrome oxidase assembly protein ShyY1